MKEYHKIRFSHKNNFDLVNTNICAEFTIESDSVDLDPDYLTETLKVLPTVVHKKGDQIISPQHNSGKPTGFYKSTQWELSTGYAETLDINSQLAELTQILKAKEDMLIELKQQYNLNYIFCIVVDICPIEENNYQVPAIYLNTNDIHFISSIDAEIIFDMYVE